MLKYDYDFCGLSDLVGKLELVIKDYMGVSDLMEISPDFFSNDFYLYRTVETGNKILSLFDEHKSEKDSRITYINALTITINSISRILELFKGLSEVREVSRDLYGFRSVEKGLIQSQFHNILETEYIAKRFLEKEPEDDGLGENEFYGITEIEDEE